jgi:hypothetical protein
MARHLTEPSRVRSATKRFVPILVTVTALPVALVLAGLPGSGTGQAAAAADVDSVRTFACPGTALDVRHGSSSGLRVGCRYGVSEVGRMRGSTTRNGESVTTRLPSRTAGGQLLVSVVQTTARSTVTMTGWTKAYDTVSGPQGVRLSAWYRIAPAGERAAVATVAPASRASMITTAFADARATAPLGSAGAVAGLIAPQAPAVSEGAVWLSSAGIAGRRARLRPPTGSHAARVLTNRHMRTGEAILTASAGGTAPTAWTASRVRAAVSGLLSVVPAPPAAVPAGAIPVSVGTTMPVDCDGRSLDYTRVSPTAITVRCGSVSPTAQPTTSSSTSSRTQPPSSTTSTSSSTSPTTQPPSSTTPTTSSSTSSTTRPPSSTTPTAPPPAGHLCSAPVFRTSGANGGWSEGGYYVHNNMWNKSKYPSITESLEACSHASWNVTATMDNASGNGEVKTYPNVHVDYHGSGANGEPTWSSIKTLRSTFAGKGPGVGIYNVAYDIWMNGVPGDNEIMIWTENHNQRPAGDVVASGVVLSGISWDVWATRDNGYLAFTPKSPLASGSLDLKAMIDYLIARGRLSAGSTLGQVCFGVEIVSTDGKPATFQFTDFSITSS